MILPAQSTETDGGGQWPPRAWLASVCAGSAPRAFSHALRAEAASPLRLWATPRLYQTSASLGSSSSTFFRWIIASAFFFGLLSYGGFVVNRIVPRELLDVLQAVILLLFILFDRRFADRSTA